MTEQLLHRYEKHPDRKYVTGSLTDSMQLLAGVCVLVLCVS